MGASLLATPAAAIDVIPEEFAAHSFEERVHILIDPSVRGVDYAELPRSGVVAHGSDELLAANTNADTHHSITVDGHTFVLTVPGAREGGAAAQPKPRVVARPRSEPRPDAALVDEMLDAAMHVSAGVPDYDTAASGLGGADAPGVSPLPEGGGLAMLTSGVAAISLLRRRAARRARSARDEAHADDRRDAVARDEGQPTTAREIDRAITGGVVSGHLA